jgi:hypothetical protein
MNELNMVTGLNDMPEITDFSRGRKNPFAEKIKKEGITITESKYYSPEDLANGVMDDTKEIVSALVGLMSREETTRLLLHIKDNYNLPCSPHVWECIS